MKGFGSPTILADANAFSAAYGLPPLTAANFKLINFAGRSACEAATPQINAEVEWAHAIAPGANIDLIIDASPYGVDTDAAEFFAVINNLGNVIVGNYANTEAYGIDGNQEAFYNYAELEAKNLINEIAASRSQGTWRSTRLDGRMLSNSSPGMEGLGSRATRSAWPSSG